MALYELKQKFIGRTLDEVPTPNLVLDLAKIEVNCERMLKATETLGLQWRAHIKTHKTMELTRFQVGEERDTPAYICVSTITEAENIIPLFEQYQARGRKVNILYAFPIYPSATTRLAAVSSKLGPSSLSLLIDHPAQLPLAEQVGLVAGHPALLFLKLDTGYHRAGVPPDSPAFASLVAAVLQAKRTGHVCLHGLYSHAGHSYDQRSEWSAMGLLATEFAGLERAASVVRAAAPDCPLVLSVGATPTSTTIQHPAFSAETSPPAPEGGGTGPARRYGELAAVGTASLMTETFAGLKAQGFALEVHAGVYPVLDLQQLATHARDEQFLSANDIAISLLAEVASTYTERGRDKTTEVLVNAGTLALGREPVKNQEGFKPGMYYDGWGLVMPWGVLAGNPLPGPFFPRCRPEDGSMGWQVGKISQEHGILTWQGTRETELPLVVGDRVRIWPNHACVTGAGHEYYLVVDSRKDGGNKVIDVWPRWRGW